MKLSGEIEVFVYKKKELEFEQGKDKMKYYRVIVDVDDEVDEIACSEEVYREVLPGRLNKLVWAFNSKADRNAFKFIAMAGKDVSHNNEKSGGKSV